MANNQKHEREEDALISEPDSSKRLKTLTLISAPGFSEEKGKQKIEDEDEDDEESDTCGICLSEEGKAIQGRIDCCNHYFCFVCIMEWAKLESRCPMCKKRFGSIRRPPKEGVFACERIVEVPVRDQVYHPLGNGTTGPPDPYAHVCCTECQSSEDESLLLLCDLCDSAAHTYCVGLGFTVPEGDWYCHDCNISRNERSDSELDNDCSYQSLPRRIDNMPTYVTDVSISEIVQEESSLAELAMHRSFSSEMDENQAEHDRPPRRGQSKSSLLPPTESSSFAAVSVREPEQGARTLHQCRNLHGHIRALRENWNALRNGSVTFSSSFHNSGSRSNIKRNNTRKGICDNSSETQPSVSKTAEVRVSANTVTKSSYDVERAWKMMEIAKLIKGATGDARSDHHGAPKSLVLKRDVNEEKRNENLSSSILSVELSMHKIYGDTTSDKSNKDHFLEPVCKKCKTPECEKPMTDMVMQQVDRSSPASHLPGLYEVQLSKQALKSSREDASRLTMQPSNSDNKLNAPFCSGLVTDPLPCPSDLSFSRTKPVVSSKCKVNPSREIVGGCRKVDDTQRKDDGAKSEVQSLVKLNLKLLGNGKPLGVDRFKEVARIATHTILAACGLEHSKSSVRSFPSLTCTHIMRSQSNLMPNACRECFYIFVKDVVDSIVAETTLNPSILKK